LVASIPLAIEIVTNATLAIGSKSLSHHGAIVARLSAIEDLAGMKILCSDKTGTLTLNKMVLEEETPVYHPGEDQESVLVYGALAAKWHEPPRDALDRLILGSVNMNSLEDYEQLGKFEDCFFSPSLNTLLLSHVCYFLLHCCCRKSTYPSTLLQRGRKELFVTRRLGTYSKRQKAHLISF